MHYWLVMPAAGAGRRFGASRPKQYAALADRTVIEWSLAPFLDDARCRGIRVAVARDDRDWAALGLEDAAGRVRAVPGGERRCDSVRNGLAALPAADGDWVLVHDAARPCISRVAIDSLLEAAGASRDGGLLAVPLADTLKRARAGGGEPAAVETTVAREGLWRALTPQMFRRGALLRALDRCREEGVEPTDESQAMERAGFAPVLVAGDPRNLKVTTAADLELAAVFIQGARA